MIGASTRVVNGFPAVRRRVKARSFKSLNAAAAYVWTAARKLVPDLGKPQTAKQAASYAKKLNKPSAPGKPPHSHTGRLHRAIQFFVREFPEEAIIGPASSIFADVANPHEFGGEFRGRQYPARPFMRPALERSVPRLPAHWANALSAGA